MHKRSLPLFAFLFLSCAHVKAAEAFTIVALPDTQVYASQAPQVFLDQTDWIVKNRKKEHIAFVGNEGDIVDAGTDAQWSSAQKALYRLDEAKGLPWATLPGNHDADQNYATYLKIFGAEHFRGRSWYGGAYNASSYVTFTGDGKQFLSLMIQYDAPGDVEAWAQRVLDAHKDLPTVVFTHDYLTNGARTDYGEKLWRGIVNPNRQVFAVFCGHMHDEYSQTSTDEAGLPVTEFLADYQDRPLTDQGYLRLYTIDEQAGTIRVQTYSPTLNKFEIDQNSSFTLPMRFDRGLAPSSPSIGLWPWIAAAGVLLAGVATLVVRRLR